jgi:hypothetical protein
MNACRSLLQLPACFVLPTENSLESIFDAVKNAAPTHQSDSAGFSFSHLTTIRVKPLVLTMGMKAGYRFSSLTIVFVCVRLWSNYDEAVIREELLGVRVMQMIVHGCFITIGEWPYE